MIAYVLIKRYYDDSGIHVCGVTEKQEVAQAFCAGGEGSDAHPEAYKIDTGEPLRTVGNSYEVIDWSQESYDNENTRDHPEPVPVPAASVPVDDLDIPF